MKHLFTIHSPLTFLVAYSTIEHLGLSREDVILLSQRYTVPIKGFRVEPAFQTKYNSFWSRLTKFNVPRHYDRYISQLTGGETFTAYVDLMSYYQKILVTHEQCQGFHFIEEGNASYMSEDDMADLTWEDYTSDMSFRNNSLFSRSSIQSIIRTLRGYNLRLISLPYHYMAYVNFPDTNFYAFSNNAFYNAPEHKRVLVAPQKEDVNMLELAKGIQLSNEVIWVDGANGRYTGLPLSYYHEAIEKAIEIMKSKGIITNQVYVKLRPGIKNTEDIYLVAALQRAGLQVVVLPGDLVLEALFIASERCTIVGVLTSALEYAHVFGHTAYSIYSLFSEQPPTFLDRMDGFWENVQSLKPN